MANSNVLEHTEIETIPATARKYRVQLDFSAEDFQELNRLTETLGMATRAELFRSALIVFRWMFNKMRNDYSVVAISPNDERIIEPEFPFFEKVKEGAFKTQPTDSSVKVGV